MILKNGSRFYFQICAAFMTNVTLLHRALYLRRQSHRALWKFLREKVRVISSRPFPTVLCKTQMNFDDFPGFWCFFEEILLQMKFL